MFETNGDHAKVVFFFPLAFCFCLLQAQKKYEVDTIIDRKVYQSFFNYKLKNPLYVTYTLYKGGGTCNRDVEGFNFVVDEFKSTASGSDYAKSGYDKGHLANAEDFANECSNEELTFRYYNCVPQNVRMNRGIWKRWETDIRKLSQTKKLYVVAGSIFGNKKLGGKKVGIPTYCYKVVLDDSTRKIIYCLLFPNNRSNTVQQITEKQLKRRMGYDLMPAAYWQAKKNEEAAPIVKSQME